MIVNARPPLRRLKRRLLLELDRPTNFAKTDLINLIAKRLNFRTYLELCTRTTGNRYSEINRSHFNTSLRLMYNCPVSFDDGLPIDFRSVDFDIADALEQLKADNDQVDICLVDSWHTYDCTIRDLTAAYDLLADGGVLVVHDCLPPSESAASPIAKPGDWCGVSYRAFLDFVIDRSGLDYCTVDIDYGCGIIFKNRAIRDSKLSLPSSDPKLIAGWFANHDDDATAFRFFMENHVSLLRLTSGKAFVRGISKKMLCPLTDIQLLGGAGTIKIARQLQQ